MRILHTMLRVGDLERSIAFTPGAGHASLRRHDYPDGKFTLAFVGYQDEQDAVLELTYNWGRDSTNSAPPTGTSRRGAGREEGL